MKLETRPAGESTSPGNAAATSNRPSRPARGAQTFPSGAAHPAVSTPDPAAERAARKAREDQAAAERLDRQVRRGVEALDGKKAEKLVVLELSGITSMSDYFVLASATNERQAQALSDAVEEAMRGEGRRPLSIEGHTSGAWILLDYGDVIFHVFQEEARRFYALERLWGDAPDATARFR